MKIILISLVALLALAFVGLKFWSSLSAQETYASKDRSASLYDLKTKTLDGEMVELGQYIREGGSGN